MRKSVVSLLVVILLSMSLGTVSLAHQHEDEMDMNKVELTAQQKEELGSLMKDILEKKKEVISKYVQFGVLSQEKAEKINSKFELHYQKLEAEGFIPKWNKDKCKGKRKNKE
ncbi:hypothetical protein BKP37_17270 [Anaerobacillus alkalilacustris]|uniref:DUF2680 domain-containing protein n=1 Tax=Anaerobacillus alkalilacustris TaxID=393763 RepID=A0A1S2LEJ2_9BACI|nr:DUF2680 domain-containing protein [Anaerobacillus alkalilacustris]OIJ10811.1 hypothetical protein BKP37_17270 [Anaerobacillus alkalilacustris]